MLVVGLGPAGLHAGALPGERRLRRRRHRRPEDRAAAGGRSSGPTREAPRPIRDWSEIYRDLDERVLEGFGGVSEYGITVRWDKNFLTLLHLTLARRRGLRMYGGVRFGGTLPIEDAWAYGFDHVAIATGAGRPTIIDMKNNLIRGIRKASDFLMALQLTGAFKRDALPNLQARLPAVVIGGGLTGIDTATELMAYYPLQVEKTLRQYESAERRRSARRASARMYDAEELELLDEFCRTAARSARSGRARRGEGEPPDFVSLVRALGRRHARLSQADGRFAGLPAESRRGDQGARGGDHLRREPQSDRSRSRRARRGERDDLQAGSDREPARQDRAARGSWSRCRRGPCSWPPGTTPNITYEKEAPGPSSSTRRRSSSSRTRPRGTATAASTSRRTPDGFFTSYDDDGRFVTYYGDNHPRYAGNVVKAMASAKDGYPQDRRALRRGAGGARPVAAGRARRGLGRRWSRRLDDELIAVVEDVVRLTPTIVEVIVKAPAAARHFQPGSSTGCRTTSRSRRAWPTGRDVPLLMEGHRADRRVGGQGARAAVADRARARRVEPAVCVPAARASRWW